jgi:hypothetical protein
MHNHKENIRVAVVFGPGLQLRPVWFDLNQRQHVIRQITNRWLERRGETPLLHFHVTDDGTLYELVYNMKEASWYLAMVEAL